MFQPTMNLNQAVKGDDADFKAFTDAAHKEAKERFNADLKERGFASEEDWESCLRAEPALDLTFYSLSLQDDLEDSSTKSYDPNASPEESFEETVHSYFTITALTAVNKILGGKPIRMLSKEKM